MGQRINNYIAKKVADMAADSLNEFGNKFQVRVDVEVIEINGKEKPLVDIPETPDSVRRIQKLQRVVIPTPRFRK